jgi:hypothetical protein
MQHQTIHPQRITHSNNQAGTQAIRLQMQSHKKHIEKLKTTTGYTTQRKQLQKAPHINSTPTI